MIELRLGAATVALELVLCVLTQQLDAAEVVASTQLPTVHVHVHVRDAGHHVSGDGIRQDTEQAHQTVHDTGFFGGVGEAQAQGASHVVGGHGLGIAHAIGFRHGQLRRQGQARQVGRGVGDGIGAIAVGVDGLRGIEQTRHRERVVSRIGQEAQRARVAQLDGTKATGQTQFGGAAPEVAVHGTGVGSDVAFQREEGLQAATQVFFALQTEVAAGVHTRFNGGHGLVARGELGAAHRQVNVTVDGHLGLSGRSQQGQSGHRQQILLDHVCSLWGCPAAPSGLRIRTAETTPRWRILTTSPDQAHHNRANTPERWGSTNLMCAQCTTFDPTKGRLIYCFRTGQVSLNNVTIACP